VIPGVDDPGIKYNNQPSAVVLVPLILPSGTTATATVTVSPAVTPFSTMPVNDIAIIAGIIWT
jgi:hypothetical protein